MCSHTVILEDTKKTTTNEMSHTEIPITSSSASSAQSTPIDVETFSNYLTSTTVRDNLINATTNQDDVNNFVFHFSWLDYAFFLGLLSLSTVIGIYYGFFSKHKQNNTNEYILGGRSMKIVPVAISMIATLVLN